MIAFVLAVGCSRVLPTLVPTSDEDYARAEGCAELGAGVSPERILGRVEALAEAPRDNGVRRAAARAFVTAGLEGAGFAVTPRPFTISGVEGVNLVATGASPGRVVVGAHVDSVRGSPGADDNASGVAVLLEVAEVLGPDAPVTWVVFDAEEPSAAYGGASVGTDGRNFAFGSQAYVDAVGPDAFDLAVVIESVGFSCTDAECQSVPAGVPRSFPRDGTGVYLAVNPSPRWAGFLGAYRRGSSRPSFAVAFPLRGKTARASRLSDHAAFWDVDVDAVLVTDTALLRNPAYHRSGDTADRLDPELLDAVARGLTAAIGHEVGRCGR